MINIKNINNPTTILNLQKRGYVIPTALPNLLLQKKAIDLLTEEIMRRKNLGTPLHEDKITLIETKIEAEKITTQINEIIHMIPNILHDTVPDGINANDNIVLQEFFNEKKIKANEPHHQIGKHKGLDIEAGVALAHTRFCVMRGDIAKMHRKLLNMALDFYANLGYEEMYLPNLVNQETMFGTGQYPKFKDDLFQIAGDRELFLIPTGEVPLTNILQNAHLTEKQANGMFMTHTPCFRKEAGAYGKDTAGILRQHQFEKVELVRFCTEHNGLTNFHALVQNIQDFIHQFEIPYRIVDLCAGDIGFAGHKAYDFEMWFPHEGAYREIATVTWCGDFQARRMNAKFKKTNGQKELLHTLNGTGLAVGRVLAALMENGKM